MTNAEYYKNCSYDELIDKFIAAYPDKSKQTVQNFSTWRNAEHITTTLIPGDVIIQDLHGSKVDVVISVDDACGRIKIRPLACVLNNNNATRDQSISFSCLTLFTGKPICNINDLQKDPSGKYHFIVTPSCPLSKSSKLSDLTPTPKANKSKKDKILDYMEKVMLIDSDYINELRAQSVKSICSESTVANSAFIFSVLYRISQLKQISLTDDFIDSCSEIAPKWLAVRKKCERYRYINKYELNRMLDSSVVGFVAGYSGNTYTIDGKIACN